MTQFTLPEIEKLELLTGYAPDFTDIVRQRLSGDFTDSIVDKVNEILIDLTEVDTLLKEARSLSFVTESKGSKLSYITQVNHLKSEGTRLLKELVTSLGIELLYNKYNPVTAYSRPSTSTVSYW